MPKVLTPERSRNVAPDQTVFHHLLGQSLEKIVEDLQTPTLIAFGDQDRIIAPQRQSCCIGGGSIPK